MTGSDRQVWRPRLRVTLPNFLATGPEAHALITALMLVDEGRRRELIANLIGASSILKKEGGKPAELNGLGVIGKYAA